MGRCIKNFDGIFDMLKLQAEVVVLGGIKITVEFTACNAEPNVGLMSDYCEEWRIAEIAGRPVRKNESVEWIYKRLSEKDGIAIDEAMCEAMCEARAWD
jgi:hypothetical protein